MKTSDETFRRLGPWIFLWFLVLAAVLAGVGFWEMELLKGSLNGFQERVHDPQLWSEIEGSLKSVSLKTCGVQVGGLVVVGVLLWWTLRSAIRRQGKEDRLVTAPSASVGAGGDRAVQMETSPEEKEEQARIDQRRSLLVLSLLQREGRLVDFLQEDLQAYDDAQIGAAVRGIQENCRESLNKYVAPRPVIDREEGESITVDAGFDANSIRLTGNVSGQPPFKGTLQHRGWRSANMNLPTVSGSQDPSIIAPAEVEIE